MKLYFIVNPMSGQGKAYKTVEKELEDAGIKPSTVRLSIGIEHIDDILADLERGFEAIK